MAVENGGEMPNEDPTFVSNQWSPRELAQIQQDEIGEAGRGLSHGGIRKTLLYGEPEEQKRINQISVDENGSWSMRDLLGSHRIASDEFEIGPSENTPRRKKDKAGKGKKEPDSGDEKAGDDNQVESRSWFLKGLLGSKRSEMSDQVQENCEDGGSTASQTRGKKMRPVRPASNTSPLISSPLRQGSPIVDGFVRPGKSRMSPSATFVRLRDERDELSKQTPSPKELTLTDGINLPLIGEIKWVALKKAAIIWLKNPKNLALLVWTIAVAVSGAVLFMVMVGMLNKAIPTKSQRDTWFEVSNQILNALFMLMALYVHPTRILHLIWLIQWKPADIVKLREVYCKGGQRKPHEWAHMVVVVLLLQLNCFAQYALSGLNWGYRRADRPAIGVGITLATSFGAAAGAGLYMSLSPLGKEFVPEDDEESRRLDDEESAQKLDSTEKGHSAHSSGHTSSIFRLHHPSYKLLEKRLSFASKEGRMVENPQWEGGLFDCHEEPTISIISSACFACVLGWNLERLGFGNRYVHIATFLLLCGAPYLVFDLAAININNKHVRQSLGITGIVLCVLALFYGGFWRIKIRERYRLPGHGWCCWQPNVTDCFQWLFCAPCSLCQEVRTAEAYDIRENRFYTKTRTGESTPGSSPDHVTGGDVQMETVPATSIQPLPNATMVPIKNSQLIPGEHIPTNLTMMFPPPTQTVDPFLDPANPFLDLEAYEKAFDTSREI